MDAGYILVIMVYLQLPAGEHNINHTTRHQLYNGLDDWATM